MKSGATGSNTTVLSRGSSSRRRDGQPPCIRCGGHSAGTTPAAPAPTPPPIMTRPSRVASRQPDDEISGHSALSTLTRIQSAASELGLDKPGRSSAFAEAAPAVVAAAADADEELPQYNMSTGYYLARETPAPESSTAEYARGEASVMAYPTVNSKTIDTGKSGRGRGSWGLPPFRRERRHGSPGRGQVWSRITATSQCV